MVAYTKGGSQTPLVSLRLCYRPNMHKMPIGRSETKAPVGAARGEE